MKFGKKEKIIILLGMLFLTMGGIVQGAITLGIFNQTVMDKVNTSELKGTAKYLTDSKDSRIINNTEKDRCVSYVNITTVKKVYEQLDYTEQGLGIMDGDFLGYSYENITEEVWYPCEYDTLYPEKMQQLLDWKKEQIIEEKGLYVEEKKTPNLTGGFK